MKRTAIALGALCLSGCDGPVTREEAAEIASDYATDTSDLESRLSALESEASGMETKLAEIEAQNAVTASEVDSLRATVNENAEAFNTLVDHYNRHR